MRKILSRKSKGAIAHLALLFCLTGLAALAAAAEPPALRGAAQLLQAIHGGQQFTRDPRAELQAFEARARELAADVPKLSPERAVDQWIELLNTARSLARSSELSTQRPQLSQFLLGALPGPTAWPELAKRFPESETTPNSPQMGFQFFRGSEDAMKLASLRAFTRLLIEDWEGARRAHAQLPEFFSNSLEASNALEPIQPFQERLKHLTGANAAAFLAVPDLAPRIGDDATRAIARQLLTSAKLEASHVSGQRTLAIFRAVARENIASLPKAPWSLCAAVEAAELFDATVARFGSGLPTGEIRARSENHFADYDFQTVVTAHLWRSLAELKCGNREQGLKRLIDLCRRPELQAPRHGNPFTDPEEQGLESSEAFAVLLQVHREAPTEWCLTALCSLAPSVPRIDELIALLPASATGVDTVRRDQNLLQIHAARGEMEALDLDVQHLIDSLRALSDNDGTGEESEGVVGSAFRQLLGLGLVTQNETWVERTLDAFRAWSKSRGADQHLASRIELVELLTQHHRFAVAESLLFEGAATIPAADGHHMNNFLSAAVQFYDRAERTADVLRLLETAPEWAFDDLGSPLASANLRLPAARALVARHEPERARPLLARLLEVRPDMDEAYALWIEMDGLAVLPELERRAAADRWQERPLIWKAELLRRSGRLDEAEAAARAALAIDPSDGDEERGHRIRGYGVLADILAARGKTEDAAFFRKVVTTVRAAERGDEFKGVGLLKAAREVYEQAAMEFADAYCVQWRLGEQYYRAGRYEESAKHYEIAFRRMPEQFGRMAALCFGCQSVFGNQVAVSAAERVLVELSRAEHPRPQALLILARLRKQQDRPCEAWDLCWRATRLDPEYIDAWEELVPLFSAVDAPAEARREVVRNLASLDPSRTHVFIPAEVYAVLGPVALWEQTRGLFAARRSGPLFPLPAAAARVQTNPQARFTSEYADQLPQWYYEIGRYPFLQLFTPYLDQAL